MTHFRTLIFLVLFILMATPARALATLPPTPTADPAPITITPDGDDYAATLDRLVSLIESLVGFIPVGMAGTGAAVLVAVTGALFVVSRLTPTKRDDEIFERLWQRILALYDRTQEGK